MGRDSDSENGYDSEIDEEFAMKPASTMVPLQEGPHTAAVFSPNSFADLGKTFGSNKINQHIVRQLETCGFNRMTYIQKFAIPVILEGRDTLLRSYTGSGKTLCFVVPILSMLADMKETVGYSRSDGTVVVVVSPTRELCQQTYDITSKLSASSPYIVTSALTGGEKRKSEKARLRKGVTILMGTPGRLRDHLESTASFHAPRLKMLVLDEADRLLDLGFEKVLRIIYDELVANVRKTSDKEIAKEVLRSILAEQKEEKKKAKTISFGDDDAEVIEEAMSDGLSSDSEDELGDDDDEMDMVLNVKGRLKVPANAQKETPAAAKKAAPPPPAPTTKQQQNKNGSKTNNAKIVDVTENDDDDDDLDLETINEAIGSDNDESEFSSGVASINKKKGKNTPPVNGKKGKKEKLQDIQVVLVSATLSPPVVRLAEFCLRGNPAWVALQQKKKGAPESIIESSASRLHSALEANETSGDVIGDEGSLDALEKRMMSVPKHLDQRVIQITLKTRLSALMALLLQYALKGKVVVFFSSCQSVEYHHALFDAVQWPNRMDSKAVGDISEGLTSMLHAAESEENRMALAEFLENDDTGALRSGGKKAQKKFHQKQNDKRWNGEDGEEMIDRLHQRAEREKQGDVAGRIMEGIPLFKLHGKLEREDRLGFLSDFTKSKTGVLFTTDVAARGLNLPAVQAVIQVDPPQQAEEYAHRVGRTARLDQAGTSIMFLMEHELEFASTLEARGAKCRPSSELGLFESFKNQIAPLHLKSIRQLAPFMGGWICRYVAGRQELLQKAREAFLAARRSYSTFSKELKPFFDATKLHLGHLAAAFAMKDTPARIAELAKKTRDRDNQAHQAEVDRTKRGDAMKKGRVNTMDEFDGAVDREELKTRVSYASKKDALRAKNSKFEAKDSLKKGPGALALAAKKGGLKRHHNTPSSKPQPELATVARSNDAAFDIKDIVGQAIKSVSKDLVKISEEKRRSSEFAGMGRPEKRSRDEGGAPIPKGKKWKPAAGGGMSSEFDN